MFGPRTGGDAEVFFNNHLSLTFDIHYSRIGSKNVYSPYTSKTGETVNSGPYNYHLDVLNTQYLGKYYIANGIALFTGIHLARILNAKYTFDGRKEGFKDEIHRGLVSIPAGIAVSVGSTFSGKTSGYHRTTKWKNQNSYPTNNSHCCWHWP